MSCVTLLAQARGYWDQNDGPRFVEWRESHDSATVAKTRHILIDPDPNDDESEARISLLHEMCHAAIAARGEIEQEQDSERGYVANHGDKWLAESPPPDRRGCGIYAPAT